MPQINIYVSKTLDAQMKNDLQKGIAENVVILPSKTQESLTICISDGLTMYKNGAVLDGAFFDVRIFQKTTENGKRRLTEKLFDIAKEILNMTHGAVNINFIELQDWGSAGLYKTVAPTY